MRMDVAHLPGLVTTWNDSLRLQRTFTALLTGKNFAVYDRATYGDNASEDPERTNEAAGQYAAACKEVGKEAGIPVLDLWSVFQQTPEWQQAFLK